MKKLYIFALVATMFAACTTDAIDEQSVKVEEQAPDTLVGTFEGDDSRIQLQNGKTVWTKGDLVSVFYRSNANQKWQYQGETGERTGTIKRVANAEATQELSDIVIVYPYNENYYINPRTYNVQAYLPAEQTYLANSYGLDGNIMISASEYKSFALKNVCGWLKIQLTGTSSQKVTSITLKGNNGEQVAGEIYINSADASCELASKSGVLGDDLEVGGTIFEDGTVLTSVTLNCVNGVELSSTAKSFYIALPPQTFEKGLTIEVACSDGSTMTKSTENAIAIVRNCIQPMAAFEYNGVLPTIPNNEIWYTATAKVEPSEASEIDATIISNEWNPITKKGVIKFNKDVTRIGDWAFGFYETDSEIITSIHLTSITIPDSVSWIGNHCFAECYNLTAFYGKHASPDNKCLIIDGAIVAFAQSGLTEYTTPTGVVSITNGAFYYCKSLKNVTISEGVTTLGYTAFYGCTSVENVVLPESLITIDYLAFGYCQSLKSITLPSKVVVIGEGAFYACNSLKQVYCKATTPPILGEDNFYYETSEGDSYPLNCPIYVPIAALNTYKNNMYWSDYADYIVGYNF